jgi:hypothetical protein
MKYKIMAIFLITMLIIGSILGSAITVNTLSTSNGNNENNLNVEMSDFEIKTMEYGWNDYREFNEPTIDGTISKTEELSIEYNENINILKNGKAKVDISIGVPQSKLADNYRDMLGVATNPKAGEAIPIPESEALEKEDTTILPVGKEGFQNSVFQEQWYSLGLITEIESSMMIPWGDDDQCRVDIEGNADLQVKELTDDKWTVNIGLFSEKDMEYKNRFISSVIGYTKLMLKSLEGEQIFKRSWSSSIILPDEATLLNKEEIDGLNWKLDFGSGTFMQATLTIKNSVISIYEILVITENDKVNPIPTGRYKSFEIEYFLPNSPIIYDNDNLTPPISSLSWEDDIFNWETSYDETWSDSGNHVTVDFHIGFSADVTVHLDTEQAWVKPEFHTEGSFDIVFSESYTYEPDPYQIFYKDWLIDIQLGPIPVVIHVEAAVELRFLFEAEASLEAHASFDADAWFKAGAKYSLWDGFNTIWESNFEKNIDEPTVNGSARLKIRPSICFPIKAKVYGLFGPVVTPELYLEGFLKYTDELFWYFKIGFCVNVGVCVGIPYLWDESWEWNVADWTIYETGSTTPSKDTLPPETTLIMYSPPMYHLGGNDWITGRYLFFWFQAIDNGYVPSGIDYTKFKVSNNNWLNYNYPDIWRAEIDEAPGYYNYDIKWYSADYFDQQETTHTYTVMAELHPPNSDIIVGDPHEANHVIANVTPITLQAQDDLTGWKIWFRIWHEGDGWSEWYNGDKNTPVSFKFTEAAVGNCKVEWCAVDGVWNFEDVQSKTFLVSKSPSKPHSPTPKNGATGVPVGSTATWKLDNYEDATYDVYFGTEPSLDSEDLVSIGQAEKFYKPSTKSGTKYYWKIVVHWIGVIVEGDIWSFTTWDPSDDNPPTTPKIIAPETIYLDEAVTFQAESTDPEGEWIRYGIDWDCDYWDTNPEVEQWTDYYPSGEAIKINHIWKYGGAKKIAFKAEDERYPYKSSGWKTIIINVEGGKVDLTINSISTDPKYFDAGQNGIEIIVGVTNVGTRDLSSPSYSNYCEISIETYLDGKNKRHGDYLVTRIGVNEIFYASMAEIIWPNDYNEHEIKAKIFFNDENQDNNIDFVYLYANLPPEKPARPQGPTSGKKGTRYTYSTSSTDPQNDQIYYKFDWGDDSTSDWLGPVESGELIEASHIWANSGSYDLKAKAKDENGHESEWSESIKISIAKSKTKLLNIQNNFEKALYRLISLFQNIIKDSLRYFPQYSKLLQKFIHI